MNKFRQFGEINIKKTKVMQYSHGGQMLACGSGKGPSTILTILNTLTMREMHTFKIGFPILQVIWNEHDDELYLTGRNGKTLSIYKVG